MYVATQAWIHVKGKGIQHLLPRTLPKMRSIDNGWMFSAPVYAETRAALEDNVKTLCASAVY